MSGLRIQSLGFPNFGCRVLASGPMVQIGVGLQSFWLSLDSRDQGFRFGGFSFCSLFIFCSLNFPLVVRSFLLLILNPKL